jgi:UDPglucose--hexose-1-phosphate uridylyltransferase
LPIACPFCPGHERETPPELAARGAAGRRADQPGWRVRVVPNKYPALTSLEPGVSGEDDSGTMAAAGEHEILIESTDHHAGWDSFPPEHQAEVWSVCRERLIALAARPEIRHVLVFKNHGEAAGATLAHPHLQIMGLPLVPAAVDAELAGLSRRPDSCLLCEIVEAELGIGIRVVSSDANFVVLAPFAPRFPFETWIVPRVHAPRFEDLPDALLAPLARACRDTARRLVRTLEAPAYNAILHTAPREGGRVYHWHLEILPRTVHAAGFEWGTGFHLNAVFPEEAAQRLREAGDGA